MSFDPTLFPGGPAYFTTNGNTFQAQDDSWKIADKSKNFDVVTNLRGKVGSRIEQVMSTISLKPIATVNNLAALLAALIPYRQSSYGTLIYPASDLTGVVQTKLGGTGNAGQSVTFAKVALTKMAKLTCGPNKPLLGDVEWTALLASGTSGSTAGNFLTIADSAYTAPTLSLASFLYDTYTLSYGTSGTAPFNNIVVDDAGIEVTPTVALEPVVTSQYGPVNMRVGVVGLEIAFRPQQMTLQNFNTLFPRDGQYVGRGFSTIPLGGALSLVGSGTGRLSLQVPNATVKPGAAGLEFNQKTGYVDKITMEANATDNAGAFVDLFTLGVVGGTLV